jgi:hypothetical protein
MIAASVIAVMGLAATPVEGHFSATPQSRRRTTPASPRQGPMPIRTDRDYTGITAERVAVRRAGRRQRTVDPEKPAPIARPERYHHTI